MAHPLLLLNRVGQGRVASVMSDQLWLWARGYEGGGPYAELIRRTAHWLMKEPELEEELLELEAWLIARGDGDAAHHVGQPRSSAMSLTGPDGVKAGKPMVAECRRAITARSCRRRSWGSIARRAAS
jgi:hypothetical protein